MIHNPNCVGCFSFETHCASLERDQTVVATMRDRLSGEPALLDRHEGRLYVGEVEARLGIIMDLESIGVEPTMELVDEIDCEVYQSGREAGFSSLRAATDTLTTTREYTENIEALLQKRAEAIRTCTGPDTVRNMSGLFHKVMRGVGPCTLKLP